MTVIYYPVLTTAGEAKLAAAVSANKKIDLVIMAIGDANGVYVAPNKSTSVLVRERYRGAIQFLEEDPNRPNRFVAEHVIPADIGGWTPREAILICADGTVFAHASLPPQPKTLLSDGGAGEMRILFYFDVATGQGAAVNIIVDPNILMASRQWVNSQFLPISKFAGGKKNAQLIKKSDSEQDYHWLDVSGIAAAKDTATYIFEFHRNRYFAYEQFGREPKQLTDLLTLNRAGTASYQSPLGLATAVAGQPRIDYDPETGECLGLLTEPSRSRITTWPEDMTSSSGNTGNWASIAPQKLVTIPGETSYSRKGMVKLAGEILTAVWEISGSEQTPILLTIDNGNTAHCGRCSFNLLTGVLSGVQSQGDFSATVASVRRIDSGFYRVELTTKTDSQLTGRLSIGVAATGAVGGGGGDINVRRQWVERGGHSTSAILESPMAAVAIRLADAGYVSMPFKITRAFTIFLWARVLASDGSNMTLAIRNSENDYIGLQYVGSTNGTYSGATFVVRNGVSYSSVSAGNFKGQWAKIAVSGEPGRLSTYHNGVKLDHANGANFPGLDLSLLYNLNFGGRGNGSLSNALTHIKEAWISPVATSDEILQLMSSN